MIECNTMFYTIHILTAVTVMYIFICKQIECIEIYLVNICNICIFVFI